MFLKFNQTFNLRKEDHKPKWRVIDAAGQTLGRLCTQIATMIRGKDTPFFTPHTDSGDYVIVVNAEKIEVTGDKKNQKLYRRYSGYKGGMKETTLKVKLEKDPAFVIKAAIQGMLPKGRLGRSQRDHLKVYAGPTHPHQAQVCKN